MDIGISDKNPGLVNSTNSMIVDTTAYNVDPNYNFENLTFPDVTFTATDGVTANREIEDLEKIPDLEKSYTNTINVATSKTSYVLYSKENFSLGSNSTCTFNEIMISIEYEIVSNNGKEIPDWVNFNTSTGVFEGTAPRVVKETVYSFILKSTWKMISPGESEQIVQITVNNNVPLSTAGAVAVATSTGTVALGGGMAAGSSLLSGSPPVGFYFILHQFQMIILMLMIDPFIPQSLRDYMKSQDFVMVNFNFIPVEDLPLIDILVDSMHSEQTSQSFRDLGFDSRSTFVNNISLFITVLFLAFLHFLLRYIII